MKVLAFKCRREDSASWELWGIYNLPVAAMRRKFSEFWISGDYAEFKLVYIDSETERELEVLEYRNR